MSTKSGEWGRGATVAEQSERETDGHPIECQCSGMPQRAVQGWQNMAAEGRAARMARLSTAGWVEGGQEQ